MNARALFEIFVLYIFVPLGIGFYAYEVLLKPNLRGWHNRQQPTLTAHAVVVDREQSNDNILYSSYYSRDGGEFHTLTFRKDSGDAVTLSVPRHYYNLIPVGTPGTLTHQGSKCERFIPDAEDFPYEL